MGSNCATWVRKPWWQIKQRVRGGISSGCRSPGSFIHLQLSTREYHGVQISHSRGPSRSRAASSRPPRPSDACYVQLHTR